MRPVVAALAVIGISGYGSGEWVSIGPTGGHIQATAIDPQDPRVLYAAYYTYPGQPEAYVSTDAGAHWRPTGGTFVYPDVFGMIVDPHRPDNVYACCEGYKFWRTTDRGQTWTDIDVPAHVSEVAADPFDEGILYAAGVVPTGEPVAMLSNDFGETWTVTVLDSLPGRGASCRVDYRDQGTVYVGCDSGRLFRTADAVRTGIEGTLACLPTMSCSALRSTRPTTPSCSPAWSGACIAPPTVGRRGAWSPGR